jgi:NADH dehydrogenase
MGTTERPRILVVGSGFAGLECAIRLERRLGPAEADIHLVSPRGYQLYLPLLPHVAAGVLTPTSVTVPIRRLLHRTTVIPGGVIGIDTAAKAAVVRKITDEEVVERYDYLVIAAGSVTRTFDIPGLTQHGRGMKTLAEAAYLRDHVISQLDLAAASNDEAERAARLCFVVVGGGYAGTETAACLQRLTTAALGRYPRLDPSLIQWHLIDIAPKLMPELGDKLGAKALEVVRRRGVQVSLGVSVKEVTRDTVTFTDGRTLPSRTLVWTAGVAASPLIRTLDRETVKGRLVVDDRMRVPGLDGVFALGDAAAVPDIVTGGDAICPPTAQHAMRQGRAVAENVVSVLRGEAPAPYRHRDLGLVVDLGGTKAVSRPLGVQLSGLPAQIVARGYHLSALRTVPARIRVSALWALNALAGDDFVRTGFQSRRPAALRDFELTDVYLSRDQVREHVEGHATGDSGSRAGRSPERHGPRPAGEDTGHSGPRHGGGNRHAA